MCQEDKIKKAFNTNEEYFQIAREWHGIHGGIAIEPQMERLIRENLKGSVLDAGCGEGSVTLLFAKNNKGINFYGVDFSRIGIKMAKSNSGNLANVILIIANLKNLPFPNDLFDLIYTQSALEHVVNYQEALIELRRVLKKGGRLIIRVANGAREGKKFLPSLFSYLFRKNRILELNPSCKLGSNKRRDIRINFDAVSIPSDILLKQLRELRYRIIYFTCNRRCITMKFNLRLFRVLIHNIFMSLPFWPFTHLGPTTILMVKKRG